VLSSPALDANLKHLATNPTDAQVLSFTTETRNLTEQQASARVAEVMASLMDGSPPAIVFKKVDSAARGNFGAETLAALTTSGALLALVAPAFPHAGRTVRSGSLSVRDCSGQDSTISLRDQFPGVDTAHIDLLPTGPTRTLLASIRSAIENGTRILLCDADTQDDLDRIAAAARQIQRPVLWVGSAGLARALAAVLPAAAAPAPVEKQRRPGRTLLFTGTPHPVTLLQLSHLVGNAPEMQQAIVRIDFSSSAEQQVQQAFAGQPVGALILNGGDTAAFVLQLLGAASIVLAGELAPGIPWGFIEGGAADGCLVVTKSGGFGEHDSLVHAFEFCSRRAHELA
jgi:uncharacterized protein YgbK (DUF1537 family)